MNKKIRLLRELYAALKFYYGKYDDRVYSSDTIINVIKILRKGKGGRLSRYLFFHGIRKRRFYKPVNVKEFQRDKKIYQEFYSNPALFKSIEEVQVGQWVTIVGGGKHPVRGKLYYEYYVNEYGVDKCRTFRVEEIYPEYDNEVRGYNMQMSYPFEILRPARPVDIIKAKEHYAYEMQVAINNMRQSMAEQIKMIEEEYSFLND